MKNSLLSGPIHYLRYFSVLVIALFIVAVTPSCTNVKNLQYLRGSFDSTKVSSVKIPEPVIQKGDLLGITVYSDDPLATAAVMRQGSGTSMSFSGENLTSATPTPSQTTNTTGYLVNQQGFLQLYKIGPIHAEGLTKDQLADTLEYFYAKENLLKNPYVEIRFLNYKVTVIGEVNRPGPYTVPTDKISAFEAIGLAGDITVYGRRDNVVVVREVNGKREFGRLDLSKPDVFLSPYYYLKQNDLVIVDVGKNKSIVNNQSTFQYVSIGASLLSIAAVFISLFRR